MILSNKEVKICHAGSFKEKFAFKEISQNCFKKVTNRQFSKDSSGCCMQLRVSELINVIFQK